MKLALNKCFGGFHLSKEAIALLPAGTNSYDIERDDPDLIQVVEILGIGQAGTFPRFGLYLSPTPLQTTPLMSMTDLSGLSMW